MKHLTGGCLCATILAAATLDDQTAVVPDDHIWAGSMVPWLEFADTLPRLATDHWEHGYPRRD